MSTHSEHLIVRPKEPVFEQRERHENQCQGDVGEKFHAFGLSTRRLVCQLFVAVACLVPGIASADITSNLELWLKFDDGSGAAAVDSSGNGRDGTVTNATWQTGQVNGCLEWDGIGDYVTVSNPVSITGDLTIGWWMLPDTYASFGRVLDNSSTGTIGYSVLLNESITGMNVNPGSIAFATSVTLSEWHHYAFVRTSGSVQLWKDGAALGSPGTISTISATTQNMIVGNRIALDRSFDGKIDELRIYSRALSSGDITELYEYAGEGGGASMPAIIHRNRMSH